MKGTYMLVRNPAAGGQEAWPEVRRALQTSGLDYQERVPDSPEQCHALGMEAQAAFKGILVAGGDGTLNRVVAGAMTEAGEAPLKPLGILPLGTANDTLHGMTVCRCQPTPGGSGWKDAVERIVRGHTLRADLGRVTLEQKKATWYFLNSFNTCFGSQASATFARHRHGLLGRLPSPVGYVAAALLTLLRYEGQTLRVRIDGNAPETWEVSLFSLLNGPRFGGLWLADSLVDDGRLDLMRTTRLGKAAALRILARVCRGTHLSDRRVITRRVRRIDLETGGEPLVVETDGELPFGVDESIHKLSVEVLPGRLEVMS